MILPRFDVLVPNTVEEACTMLAEYGDKGVRLLAGGTDLLVDLRRPIIPFHVPRCDGCQVHPDGNVLTTIECGPPESGQLMSSEGSIRTAVTEKKAPAYLISLHKLDMLKGISLKQDGGLRIGALTTIADITRSSDVRKHWAALGEGADSLGSPLVRNRGTLGGNIANARPAADMVIPTVGLGATLTLKGIKGTRTVSASEFPIGPGTTVIEPNEIITDVCYPAPLPYSDSAYYKLANRKALEISTVGVAVWMALEKPDGPIADVRIALGAVGPTPILAESASDVLVGKIPDDKLLIETSRAVCRDARPIDDHRGSAWYRIEMVEVLTFRLLKVVLERIRSER